MSLRVALTLARTVHLPFNSALLLGVGGGAFCAHSWRGAASFVRLFVQRSCLSEGGSLLRPLLCHRLPPDMFKPSSGCIVHALLQPSIPHECAQQGLRWESIKPLGANRRCRYCGLFHDII